MATAVEPLGTVSHRPPVLKMRQLFLGPIGVLVRRLLVRGWVAGIFDYRAGEVPALLTRAPAAPPRRTA